MEHGNDYVEHWNIMIASDGISTKSRTIGWKNKETWRQEDCKRKKETRRAWAKIGTRKLENSMEIEKGKDGGQTGERS